MPELVGDELTDEKLCDELDMEGVKGFETVEWASEWAMYTLGCLGVLGWEVLPPNVVPKKVVDVDWRE